MIFPHTLSKRNEITNFVENIETNNSRKLYHIHIPYMFSIILDDLIAVMGGGGSGLSLISLRENYREENDNSLRQTK